MGDLKTLGAVEIVLGLMEVSLGATLLPVHKYIKVELVMLFVTGGLSALVGFGLVCGGQKPSYACVKFNMAFNLSLVLLSAVSLGSMARHVPYREDRYCKNDCDYICHSTMVLLNSLLAVLVTILVMQTLVGLVAGVQGYCCIMLEYPEPPENTNHIGSNTAELLCVPQLPNQVVPAYNSTMDGETGDTPSFPAVTASSNMNTPST